MKLTLISLLGLFALVYLNEIRNGNNKLNEDVTKHFNKICIEGHIYYERTLTHNGYLSPILNDNGTPVKCTKEQL